MSACDLCAHPYADHDGMGDCTHVDRRTATGFCTRHDAAAASEMQTLGAWYTWSQASGGRYGAPMMAAFRSGYRIGYAPTSPETSRLPAGGSPADRAWTVWCAKSDNTRYGSLNYQAFTAGFAVGAEQMPDPGLSAGLRRVEELRAELAALRSEQQAYALVLR